MDPVQYIPDGDVGYVGDLDADGVEEDGDLQVVRGRVRCRTVEDLRRQTAVFDRVANIKGDGPRCREDG